MAADDAPERMNAAAQSVALRLGSCLGRRWGTTNCL